MIELQFVCGQEISSQMIAWFSSGHFSHVDTVLPSGDLLGARSDKVGGKPAGVQIRTPGYAPWVSIVRVKVPTTDKQEASYYNFLSCQLGKPYDKLAIFGFLTNRDWREKDSWICSELVAAAAESAGIFLAPLLLPANKITPVCAAVAFTAIGGKTTVVK